MTGQMKVMIIRWETMAGAMIKGMRFSGSTSKLTELKAVQGLAAHEHHLDCQPKLPFLKVEISLTLELIERHHLLVHSERYIAVVSQKSVDGE